MSTDLVPIDYTSELANASHPTEMVVTTVEWTKAWLAEALNNGDVVGIAQFNRLAAVREAVALGTDTELEAAEIARRAERALGLALLAAQADGRISEDEEAATRCLLYRHYDHEGVLLYVGISDRPSARGRAHAIESAWVQFADYVFGDWYPSRAEAEEAEIQTIEREQPVFNVVHAVGDPRARIVAYLKQRYERE